MSEPTVTLREHFDDKFAVLHDEIADMKAANAEEHAAVIAELKQIKAELPQFVTWKSLGASIAVIGGLVGLVAGLASLLGIG